MAWALAALANAISVLALSGGLGLSQSGFSAETSLPEYQVKALFLMNFAKYVDWPPVSFAAADSPVVIGLYGEYNLEEALQKVVAGKRVGGRPIVIQRVDTEDAPGKCHILFISESERKRVGEILEKLKPLPVVTVGETELFLQQGGVINFVKKQGKIRLEINLSAARQANLAISSKLLTVADVVLGKAE